MPKVIAQTADGYLWIGTQTGIVRFDGARFTPFTPPTGPLTSSQPIEALLGGSDGSLWIGAYGSLFRWNGQHIDAIKMIGVVQAIQEDRDGTIWMTRSRASATDSNPGPLCAVRTMVLKCYGKADGIPFKDGRGELIDSAANVWVASETQVTRWNPGSSHTYTLPGMNGTESLDGIEALESGPDSSVLVGVRFADGLGLQTLAHDEWVPYRVPGFDGNRVSVSSLFKDRENNLWIGTIDEGIYRIHAGAVDHFRASDGLSSDTVNGLYEDREGSLWVATSNGVDRFRDMQIATFSKQEGLTANTVNSVLATRDGTVWFGNGSALDSLKDGHLSSFAGKSLPGKEVTSLLEDHLGKLWVGIDEGLYTLKDGRFIAVRRQSGAPTGSVIAITEDSENNVWVQAIGANELLRIKDGVVQEVISEDKVPVAFALAADPQSGIWLGLVNGKLARYLHGRLDTFPSTNPVVGAGILALTIAPNGAVWGASSQGLISWQHGVVRALTTDNGLPCNRINSLVADRHGSLWLYAQCGLIEISSVEIEAWSTHSATTVKTRLFGPFDGAHPGRASFQPTASLGPDGKLWFVNESVAQVIDPAQLPFNPAAPLMHIEQLVADRKTYSLSGNSAPVLPARTRDLEIDYTALSLMIPEKVKFRYFLEGRDTTWEEPGSRRQAFFTNLAAGHYRFHVIAANNDGVWNEKGADLIFTVAAAWYQKRSFLAGCVLIFFFALWCLYRLRVNQVAKAIGARFDERMAERTRLAQELHDTLLQTIQGSKMVADDALNESTDLEKMRATMRRLSQWLGQAVSEGRAALASLRVSVTKQNDLADSFQRAVEDCLPHRAMEVTFSVLGDVREMHPIARDEVYRIGYEAIRNATSHSAGTLLTIELSYSNDLELRVRDNGTGIDPTVAENGREGHFGLRGMRERAIRIGGHLIVESNHTGTVVRLFVPGKAIFRPQH